jgi:hypothetical protein
MKNKEVFLSFARNKISFPHLIASPDRVILELYTLMIVELRRKENIGEIVILGRFSEAITFFL